eukprot:Gb_24662 [translate_table: standard]
MPHGLRSSCCFLLFPLVLCGYLTFDTFTSFAFAPLLQALDVSPQNSSFLLPFVSSTSVPHNSSSTLSPLPLCAPYPWRQTPPRDMHLNLLLKCGMVIAWCHPVFRCPHHLNDVGPYSFGTFPIRIVFHGRSPSYLLTQGFPKCRIPELLQLDFNLIFGFVSPWTCVIVGCIASVTRTSKNLKPDMRASLFLSRLLLSLSFCRPHIPSAFYVALSWPFFLSSSVCCRLSSIISPLSGVCSLLFAFGPSEALNSNCQSSHQKWLACSSIRFPNSTALQNAARSRSSSKEWGCPYITNRPQVLEDNIEDSITQSIHLLGL